MRELLEWKRRRVKNVRMFGDEVPELGMHLLKRAIYILVSSSNPSFGAVHKGRPEFGGGFSYARQRKSGREKLWTFFMYGQVLRLYLRK